MPYRREIVAVSESLSLFILVDNSLIFAILVGKPIHVRQSDKPTLEEVMEVQKQYIEELTRYAFSVDRSSQLADLRSLRIWNTYKDKFAKARLRELNIID